MSKKRKINNQDNKESTVKRAKVNATRCTIKKCRYNTLHNTADHKCGNCGANHSRIDCNVKIIYTNCDDQKLCTSDMVENVLLQFADTKNVYAEVCIGMGCSLYIKRNNLDNNLLVFMLHSDNQGQYGEDTNDLPKLKVFLQGYEKINK